jgi:hypothetical protein
MSKPMIHGKRRALSASSVLEATAADLLQIKQEDGLSFKDIGRVFGKSEDQAAKYCDGTAEMGLTAYAFGKAQWNGRFTGSLDALILDSRGHTTSDRSKATVITKALFEISAALEDDEEASPREVRAMRKSLEEAKDAIEGFLEKLRLRSAA